MNKKRISPKTAIVLGAGAVALAAASFYFFGPNSKDRQKKLKGWMIKMKGEIIEKLETSGKVTEAVYQGIVDTVGEEYRKTIDQKELSAFVANLKKHWKNIQKAVTSKSSKKNNNKI